MLNSQPTILVVENDGPLRQMIVSTLSALGFSTLEAESADEALVKFRGNDAAIDLAIIEFQIPAVSGLDLAAELERLQPGISVLYMSALHESIAIESIGQRSPERVLLKPFGSEDLVARARNLLAGKSGDDRRPQRHRAGSAD